MTFTDYTEGHRFQSKPLTPHSVFAKITWHFIWIAQAEQLTALQHASVHRYDAVLRFYKTVKNSWPFYGDNVQKKTLMAPHEGSKPEEMATVNVGRE